MLVPQSTSELVEPPDPVTAKVSVKHCEVGETCRETVRDLGGDANVGIMCLSDRDGPSRDDGPARSLVGGGGGGDGARNDKVVEI